MQQKIYAGGKGIFRDRRLKEKVKIKGITLSNFAVFYTDKIRYTKNITMNLGVRQLKECPKCKQLNGDNRTDCWNCHAVLRPVSKYRKVCPKCGTLYPYHMETCEECGRKLSVYDWEINYNNSVYASETELGFWMYAIAVLIPLLGIILGCIYIARGDDRPGKSLIITGVVSNLVGVILGFLLSAV